MAYNAFISYNHSADGALATALQSALHRFAKPWYKLRALHIFRDQTNLAVNPALWSSIRDALDQSFFLILLASPESAVSPWVAKETEYWAGRNGPSHILIVLTAGDLAWDGSANAFSPERTNALAPPLLRVFPEEPLFLDLRWSRDSGASFHLHEPRFHEAILQLASTLHNRPKDELDGADIRSQRHTRWLAASVAMALILIGLFALRMTRLSRVESNQNLAAALAADSAKILADSPDRVREAALLALESTRLDPSFEANQALRSAVSLLPGTSRFYEPEDSNPAERIRDLTFAPGVDSLAVVRDDGSTQLIDIKNRNPVRFLTPDTKPVNFIQLPGKQQDEGFDNNAAVSVSFNANGSLVASGGRDGVVRVWALPDGHEVLRIWHAAPVSQLAFRPGANEIVTASDDGWVRIFEVPGGAMVASFECPEKAASAVFSPDGKLVAGISSDGPVRVFDIAKKKVIRTLSGGEAAFNLVFSADGKRLAAASGEFAFVWDVASGQQLLKATHAASSETLTPQQWIIDVAISSNGEFLAYAARGHKLAYVWNVDTGRQILQLKHGSSVAAVAFSSDGTKLGTGSYDGTARVWELPSGNELARASHPGGAEVVLFSPDGSTFAAGGIGGTVSVSDTRPAERPASFELPREVHSVAFSPDGRRFAIGTVSKMASPMVRIAESRGGSARDIEFHGAPVIDKLFFVTSNEIVAQWSSKLFLINIDKSSVTELQNMEGEKRIDPSGKIFAIQRDGVSRIYSLPDMRPIAALDTGAAKPAFSLLRTAGNGSLLAFEADKPPNEFFVDIWSVAKRARASRIPLPAELNRIAFNPAGTLMFTAENNKLQAFEIPSGKRLFSVVAEDEIQAIVPDPTSAAFAIVVKGRLTVWDARTGQRLAQLPDAGYLRAAAFSPDGRYLLAGYDERTAAVWLWRSSDLQEQACARAGRNFSREEWANWFPKQPYRQTCSNLPAEK